MANKNYLDKSGLSYFWGKIKSALTGKQDALVSGTNIKTINNESLLGSGNITVSADGGTVLYSNDSGTTGDITITDNFTDYNRVDLIVSCVDGYSDYGVKIHTIYPKMFSKWNIVSEEYGNYWGSIFYEIITISNNTITRGNNHVFSASKPDGYVLSSTWNQNNNYRSKIYKVIGYK